MSAREPPLASFPMIDWEANNVQVDRHLCKGYHAILTERHQNNAPWSIVVDKHAIKTSVVCCPWAVTATSLYETRKKRGEGFVF